MIRNKETLSFEIKDNSVRLIYNQQHIVFNTYNCPSRHKFNQFKNTIANSSKDRYADINSIYRLARLCEVKGIAGTNYTLHKNIAY